MPSIFFDTNLISVLYTSKDPIQLNSSPQPNDPPSTQTPTFCTIVAVQKDETDKSVVISSTLDPSVTTLLASYYSFLDNPATQFRIFLSTSSVIDGINSIAICFNKLISDRRNTESNSTDESPPHDNFFNFIYAVGTPKSYILLDRSDSIKAIYCKISELNELAGQIAEKRAELFE